MEEGLAADLEAGQGAAVSVAGVVPEDDEPRLVADEVERAAAFDAGEDLRPTPPACLLVLGAEGGDPVVGAVVERDDLAAGVHGAQDHGSGLLAGRGGLVSTGALVLSGSGWAHWAQAASSTGGRDGAGGPGVCFGA